MKFNQCELRKEINDKSYYQITTWIPENLAVKDNIVRIKDYKGEWDDGWVVYWAGEYQMNEGDAAERSRDYTKQRKASDI